MNGRTDPERIVDMAQYSREAIATLGNTSFEEFSANRQLQLGIFLPGSGGRRSRQQVRSGDTAAVSGHPLASG